MSEVKRRIVVGDVQACFDSFQSLLDTLKFDFDSDQIFLVGDLINRGPKNVEMMEWILAHKNRIRTVLGNHELFFLANYFGLIDITSNKDTVSSLSKHTKCSEYVRYLLNSDFIKELDSFLLVHAGIPPNLSLDELRTLHTNIKKTLANEENWKACLDIIFNQTEQNYTKELIETAEYMKFFTMVRAVFKSNKRRVPRFSGSLSQLEKDQEAWFSSLEPKNFENKKIIFGHWAALGLHLDHRVVACDSACVWGEYLSAYILEENGFVSVSAKEKKL